jgi:hypothetical protein
VRILIATSESPTDLKKILKAPDREIQWAVDLKNAARLTDENKFDILIIEPNVIENWPDKIALANYVHFIEYIKEKQPNVKVILAGLMEEDVKERKNCRHYPAVDGRWIYQEKDKPTPDYIVNVCERLPSGVVSCSYERLIKTLREVERGLKTRKTARKPNL